jgi:hypothetical protein
MRGGRARELGSLRRMAPVSQYVAPLRRWVVLWRSLARLPGALRRSAVPRLRRWALA